MPSIILKRKTHFIHFQEIIIQMPVFITIKFILLILSREHLVGWDKKLFQLIRKQVHKCFHCRQSLNIDFSAKVLVAYFPFCCKQQVLKWTPFTVSLGCVYVKLYFSVHVYFKCMAEKNSMNTSTSNASELICAQVPAYLYAIAFASSVQMLMQ